MMAFYLQAMAVGLAVAVMLWGIAHGFIPKYMGLVILAMAMIGTAYLLAVHMMVIDSILPQTAVRPVEIAGTVGGLILIGLFATRKVCARIFRLPEKEPQS